MIIKIGKTTAEGKIYQTRESLIRFAEGPRCVCYVNDIRPFLSQIERNKSVRAQRADCVESSVTCDKQSEEAEPTNMGRKLGTIRGNQQSCINRVARETKTAGTLAVVVGGFVACWLPFFILYLATPFVPMEPPDILMLALTWLGR